MKEMKEMFKNKLKISPIKDSNFWILLDEFVYITKSGLIVKVPKNFKTDFASVPRLFWRILPVWGSYGEAAVVHDYLYSQGKISRRDADLIFLGAMEESGTCWIIRWLIYLAVRIGGKSHYKSILILSLLTLWGCTITAEKINKIQKKRKAIIKIVKNVKNVKSLLKK